jgi:hypothetical protein
VKWMWEWSRHEDFLGRESGRAKVWMCEKSRRQLSGLHGPFSRGFSVILGPFLLLGAAQGLNMVFFCIVEGNE